MTDAKKFFENNVGRWNEVFKQRAQAGKEFLLTQETEDRKLSNVDLQNLDQNSYYSCVAAQFCGLSYTCAMAELNVDFYQARALGFTVSSEVISQIMDEADWDADKANDWAYGQLTLAWIEALSAKE